VRCVRRRRWFLPPRVPTHSVRRPGRVRAHCARRGLGDRAWQHASLRITQEMEAPCTPCKGSVVRSSLPHSRSGRAGWSPVSPKLQSPVQARRGAARPRSVPWTPTATISAAAPNACRCPRAPPSAAGLVTIAHSIECSASALPAPRKPSACRTPRARPAAKPSVPLASSAATPAAACACSPAWRAFRSPASEARLLARDVALRAASGFRCSGPPLPAAYLRANSGELSGPHLGELRDGSVGARAVPVGAQVVDHHIGPR
jgi:hypothetical protein